MADETGNDRRSEQGNDIVTRLRKHAVYDSWWPLNIFADAADDLERLRAASETLAKAVATHCGDEAWADRALAAYEEARRG